MHHVDLLWAKLNRQLGYIHHGVGRVPPFKRYVSVTVSSSDGNHTNNLPQNYLGRRSSGFQTLSFSWSLGFCLQSRTWKIFFEVFFYRQWVIHTGKAL